MSSEFQVEPFTPRRRRGHQCEHLELIEIDTRVLSGWSPHRRLQELTGRKEYGCDRRRAVSMNQDWVIDVCLSSWGASCPFLPEK